MNVDLPIFEIADDLVRAFKEVGRVILEAPTGSGKSTQVPQILLRQGLAGNGRIIILQPRRLATRMLAARVASERGSKLGAEVGYQIRFDNVTSAATRLNYVTEGILLRMMLENPKLPGVSVLLFDEFHERHLFGDVSLARALDLQESLRPDLKIGIMSATLRGDRLREKLAPCQTLVSAGRMFPVETAYLDRAVDFDRVPVWEAAARELDRVLASGKEGDALVFMPGAAEIHRTIQALQATPRGRECSILPLHGELPVEQQDAAMERHARRKVIVSTNVAETSLTIDGVRIVIDSGLARIPAYDPHRGINTLLVGKISQASADQRTGRAGRTAPGFCLRLWTEREHALRPSAEPPEVQRLDLTEIVLTLKAAGLTDIASFRWLDPPHPLSLQRAETLLRENGALCPDSGVITPLGRRMLAFPLHPRFSRMLLAAEEHRCVSAAALAAALTQNRPILIRRPGEMTDRKREDLLGDERESDFFRQMRAWNHAAGHRFSLEACRAAGIHAKAARQVAQTHAQLLEIARRQKLATDSGSFQSANFRKCLLSGFPDHVAFRIGAGTVRYALPGGNRRGTLEKESVVRDAEWIVAAEIRERETGGEVDVLLGNVTAIERDWLRELFPNEWRVESRPVFDPATRRVVWREETVFRGLVVESKQREEVPAELAAGILAEEVRQGRCVLKNWDHAVDQWIARLNCLCRWMPELGLPPLTEEDKRHLLQQICHGATGAREIKDRPVLPVVRSWISDMQEGLLDRFAPATTVLPSGRRPKIVYAEDAPPTLSARVQDLYGLEENLRVANGKVEVRVQILAPNQRPVQITQNMAAFWKDSYPAIKKQLSGRYPKHEWR